MNKNLLPLRNYVLSINIKRVIALAAIVLVCYGQLNAAIRYVNINASGANNGTSWANAYTDFKTAVDAAVIGDEIWVAKGTYQTASGNSFSMKNGVKIYGGFNGGELSLSDRNFLSNPTKLMGNNQRVIYNSSLNNTATIDGFIITGGVTNAGGAMYNDNSSPIFYNCTFTQNTATYGGAIGNYQSSPTFYNCVFSQNTANYGGGVDNEQSSPTFYNCIFKENTAIDAGDGIYNYSGTITLVNTTMVNNGAYGFRNGSGADLIIIKNSIIWDNIDGGYTATNSLIKGTNPTGAGNINATNLTVNEVFADASNLDYALNQNSIALNKGDNASFLGLGSTTLDLAGNARVYKYNNSGVIDLGAYEYQGDPAVLPVTLVDFIAKIEGNGVILQWQTANETNNKGFIVYRKGDVGEFVSLSEINADNSSTVGYQRYQFADQKPLNGNNYYKLVQVDKDGEPTDLGTRALSFSLSTLSIQLYPNPTTSKVFLNEEVEGSFVLFNNIGQKIANGTLAQLRSGWDISSLQKGIYYFSINGNSYKILKQ
ncbi:T9SS type A sorting domain-containing protein [Pedobacter helvus]|uniref:T9SS type A sorting domain-containing protein n=1 Tax=Pedobacter helvus TaxID=2563444 RepID=A0ABW9JJU0_9SPHI|nr:T9SS type A sorting domain-containing protein [Pedobacter ureilyticus]